MIHWWTLHQHRKQENTYIYRIAKNFYCSYHRNRTSLIPVYDKYYIMSPLGWLEPERVLCALDPRRALRGHHLPARDPHRGPGRRRPLQLRGGQRAGRGGRQQVTGLCTAAATHWLFLLSLNVSVLHGPEVTLEKLQVTKYADIHFYLLFFNILRFFYHIYIFIWEASLSLFNIL